MSFKIGDKVTWSSQAQSYEKEKLGVVIEVVEPGQRPNRAEFEDLYRGSGCGFGRDHVSYVVRVATGKAGKGKPKHYWPRASALKPASE